ncbi:MAG TPA: L-threonylcarbamoyladenylate synthase [Usitatibacter sp.]|jgi:L-threonylcarbamoyladenylate synthase|nr:L-threonylcarbamoyladenylate synthase [Usitatibacter sp.]
MANVAEAVRRLAAGELVAFPTETVYGLGADAANAEAVAKIFALKGRPEKHPLIVHIADPLAIEAWARHVPEAARKLADRFWPGPLTMIVPKSARVPAAVTGGQDTVGLRCPSHPLAQELLREFARAASGGVAAPSANRFGHVSPTTARHVRDEFGESLFVLDGGPCEVGLESTIVDLSRGAPVLLRPGAITRRDIEAVLGIAPAERDAAAPRASGTLAAHYAPRTPLALVDVRALEAEMAKASDVAVLAMHPKPPGVTVAAWIDAPGDPLHYAHDLYANLRTLDRKRAAQILVEAPPALPGWEAVNDRLKRAAAGSASENEAT